MFFGKESNIYVRTCGQKWSCHVIRIEDILWQCSKTSAVIRDDAVRPFTPFHRQCSSICSCFPFYLKEVMHLFLFSINSYIYAYSSLSMGIENFIGAPAETGFFDPLNLSVDKDDSTLNWYYIENYCNWHVEHLHICYIFHSCYIVSKLS